MSTDDELRSLLRAAAAAASPRSIDTDRVIRRSRRRHVGRQAATGGVTALAVVGLTVAGVTGVRGLLPHPANLSSASDAAAPESEGSAITRAPAEKINLCGGTLAEARPAESGLVLSMAFPPSASTGGRVSGQVTMTNTGPTRVTGTTAATPAITLSQDGLVLWHSNGPMIAMVAMVDLEPGASMTYPASFIPVRCSSEDETAPSFREGLPAVPAGDYQISAAIDFVPEDGSAQLVTSQVAEIRID